MKLVVATTNPGKLEELQALLPERVELVTLRDVGLNAPDENGATFLENARLKAQAVASAGYMAIADDSGLVVDALDGEPGVHSARYAGAAASDDENNQKLISNLTGVPTTSRTARFRSAVVLAHPDGDEVVACGSVEGLIVDTPRGSNGFGYDPYFEVEDQRNPEYSGKTMAELNLAEKNQISHRSRAYNVLLDKLSTTDLAHGNFRDFAWMTNEGNPT